MTAAPSFSFAELDRAIKKLANEEPLTPDEGLLVHRKVDALIESGLDDEGKLRRQLRVPEGQPLPPDVVAELAWRKANVDNADPVLRAVARAPIVGEPWSPEELAELDLQVEDLRAGRVRAIPHEEIERALDLRRREETERT